MPGLVRWRPHLAWFPACIEDVETAIRWVKSHAAEFKADPQRIALIGESAGGYLVSLAGVRAQDDTRVATVVPFYAPHDLESRVKQSQSIPPWVDALFGLFVEQPRGAR